MYQYLPLTSVKNNWMIGLVVNLTLQSLIFSVLTKLSCLVLLFNVSDTSMIFQIESLSQNIVEAAMDWIRDSKTRVIPSHLKVAYWFCLRLIFAWWGLAIHFLQGEVCRPYKCFCNMQKIFSDMDSP